MRRNAITASLVDISMGPSCPPACSHRKRALSFLCFLGSFGCAFCQRVPGVKILSSAKRRRVSIQVEIAKIPSMLF